MSLLGWTLKPQTKRGVCLALIVGQLRGVGRRIQPEFGQDVSSSRGNMVDSGNFVGFCSSQIKPFGSKELFLEYGTQNLVPSRNFWALLPTCPAHSYLTPALFDHQPIHPCVSPHLVSGWSSDPCRPRWQVSPGNTRGCLWGL